MLSPVGAVRRLALWAMRAIVGLYVFTFLVLIHPTLFGVGPEGFVRPLMESVGIHLQADEDIAWTLEELKGGSGWVETPFQWDMPWKGLLDPHDVDPLDWGRLLRYL
jgi:hypothetical protein